MTAIRLGVNPETTTYVSRPLQAGWLATAPTYTVKTYANDYPGSMNLVRATLRSDNSVYAQLDADVGPEQVTKTARMMGITSPLHSYPAEGLGGLTDGVSPLEMARAYATIASGGYRYNVTAIRKVDVPRRPGRARSASPKKKRVFTDGEAYEATKILEQNVKAGTGFPNATAIGCPAAGKTGTVDDNVDAWFVGFTPRLATAVWLGHAKSRIPMPGITGGTIPAHIWGQYMKVARGQLLRGVRASRRRRSSAGPSSASTPAAAALSGSSTSSRRTRPRRRPAAAPGASGPATDGTSTGTTDAGHRTPDTTTGGGAANGKYPPDQYESPPAGRSRRRREGARLAPTRERPGALQPGW